MNIMFANNKVIYLFIHLHGKSTKNLFQKGNLLMLSIDYKRNLYSCSSKHFLQINKTKTLAPFYSCNSLQLVCLNIDKFKFYCNKTRNTVLSSISTVATSACMEFTFVKKNGRIRWCIIRFMISHLRC